MFGLLAKLAEILSSYGLRLVDGRRGSRDAEVAERVLDVMLMLQDLVVRGERLLTIAERLIAGTAEDDQAAEFRDLLARQVDGMDEVRATLTKSQELLATIDGGLYLDLVPFLDQKSGLLTRWRKQAARSKYSTTTLFFLAEGDLRQAVEAGRAHAGPHGMDIDRTDYLLAVSAGLRRAHDREVRDIRVVGAGDDADDAHDVRDVRDVRDVQADIDAARQALGRARTLCVDLSKAMEQTFGPETMAAVRRRLLRRAE